MKTTGFLTLHDKNFHGSKDLKESLQGGQNNVYRDKIINYLESGYSFTGVPLMLHDDEGVAFNGLEYLTDGVWIWPNYYAYYLKKYPSMKIEEEFINYLTQINFSLKELTKEEKLNADKYFQDNIW